MKSIKEIFAGLKSRWKGRLRKALRPLDQDDKEALTFLVSCCGEILRDGEITHEENTLLGEAWSAWKEARRNTP